MRLSRNPKIFLIIVLVKIIIVIILGRSALSSKQVSSHREFESEFVNDLDNFIHDQVTEIYDLGDSNWTVKNENSSIFVPNVKVPGGIFTDLFKGGVLDNGAILYRFNDVEYSWVGRQNWIYEKTFELPFHVQNFDNVMLNFEGLDTICDVILNGKLLGSTENMFVRYRFDIKQVNSY